MPPARPARSPSHDPHHPPEPLTTMNGISQDQSALLPTVEDKDVSLTPLSIIRSLGEFDLDCCGLLAHPTAKRIYQLPDDGLMLPWTGRVWCNPPYSKPEPWMRRMAEHGSGVALVLASTGTKWFQRYCFEASAVLFLEGRPKFTRMDGSRFLIMRDCALVAFSKKDAEALKSCGLAGTFRQSPA